MPSTFDIIEKRPNSVNYIHQMRKSIQDSSVINQIQKQEYQPMRAFSISQSEEKYKITLDKDEKELLKYKLEHKKILEKMQASHSPSISLVSYQKQSQDQARPQKQSSASHIEVWRKMHGIEKNIPIKRQMEQKTSRELPNLNKQMTLQGLAKPKTVIEQSLRLKRQSELGKLSITKIGSNDGPKKLDSFQNKSVSEAKEDQEDNVRRKAAQIKISESKFSFNKEERNKNAYDSSIEEKIVELKAESEQSDVFNQPPKKIGTEINLSSNRKQSNSDSQSEKPLSSRPPQEPKRYLPIPDDDPVLKQAEIKVQKLFPSLSKADLKFKVKQFIKEYFPKYYEEEGLIKPPQRLMTITERRELTPRTFLKKRPLNPNVLVGNKNLKNRIQKQAELTEWKLHQLERKARLTHKFELEGNGILGTKTSLFMPKRPNSSYCRKARNRSQELGENGSEVKVKVKPFDLHDREESSDHDNTTPEAAPTRAAKGKFVPKQDVLTESSMRSGEKRQKDWEVEKKEEEKKEAVRKQRLKLETEKQLEAKKRAESRLLKKKKKTVVAGIWH